MISLYVHIPFCDYKCEYCNFYVIQKNHPNFLPNLISDYIISLKNELNKWKDIYPDEQIRTIYLWWGTPSSIWKEYIKQIIDHISLLWSLEFLEELSIELNPDPFDSNIDLIKDLSNTYKNFPRIRFSFGIQTLDDDVLELAGRQYVFNNIKWFLRNLQPIKKPNMVYNFDMIAFGTLQNWNKSRLEFWEDFVRSMVADSFSVYTLELFPWSKWHQLSHGQDLTNHSNTSSTRLLQKMIHPDDEKIMEEFEYIKNTLYKNGYNRYETSNFARPGFGSIHNQVYWNLDPYIWVWCSASGLVYEKDKDKLINIFQANENKYQDNIKAVRYTNTTSISDYIKGNYVDPKKTTLLSSKDLQIEWFFLKMRSWGVKDIERYKNILIHDYQHKIEILIKDEYIIKNGSFISFTDNGYDLSNTILSDIIEF